MPLTVTIVYTRQIQSFNVSQNALNRRANSARRNATGQVIAFTLPIISTDQRQLQYQQRRVGSQVQFRFDTGTLILRLRHEIYYANTLPACEREIWRQHELDHVSDNRQVMAQMEGEIKRDPILRSIFVTRQWRPISQFQRTQQDIFNAVGAIFTRLTRNASSGRDTQQVYRLIQRRVLNTCPEPFFHIVERNETLSFLALYFYGRARLWPAIYDRNRGTIGSDPDLIVPGQQLLIPKNPRVR